MPDNDQLLNVIDAYEANAYGSDTDGGELSRQRGLALDAYQGKNIEPAPEGRSQVVDWSMFETVQWIMPSLTRIFASGDAIVEFEPENADDEDVAKQESEYLNYLVTRRNNWFLTCVQWFQDALITKNAYVMAFMEEKIVPEIESYENQSEEQVAMLLDDEVEVIEQSQQADPDDEGTVVHPATGQPVQSEEELFEAIALYQVGQIEPELVFRQIFDLKIRRSKPVEKLQFRVLPPERCKVDQATTDYTLEDCDYFEYWEIETISDLRKLGFDVEDDIGDDTDRESTVEDTSRDDVLQTDQFDRTDPPDPSLKRVRVRTIWVRHDYDEDGVAELQRAIVVGRTVLEREEVSTIPVASIVPFLNTHRHVGMSVGDLTFDIQRIKTALLRSGLDSTYLSLNPERAISNEVHLDDMLISRPGGVKRMVENSSAVPGEGHIMDLAVPYVAPQAFEGMNFMDRVIESRVGVSRMFQGIDESNINDHNRVGQLSTMAAQRVEQIARIFGNGVERLFRIAHEMIIKSGHQAQALKLRGEWVDIDPSEWRTGRDMRVVAPYAAGNKDSLLQRLMVHMGIHEKALSAGAPFVQIDDAYQLALEIAKATDIPGDRIYTDPATIEPPPPQPDPTMVALEIEGKKVENEAIDEERKAQLDAVKSSTEDETRRFVAQLNSETQIALAQLKAGGSVDLEQFKADLKNAPIELGNEAIDQTRQLVAVLNQQLVQFVDDINEKFDELQESAGAEKEVVRENGKIVGVRSNGQLKKVKRDEAGDIVGL